MQFGTDRFILSGYPHPAECRRFAESAFPKLPLRRRLAQIRGRGRHGGLFGQVISNIRAPSHRRGSAQARIPGKAILQDP
jgi:alkanesulfonate monooxygenase